MALPIFDSGARKKRDAMLAVDLGSRVTKAVHMQRRGDGFALCGFALMDAPIFDKALSADMLAEHLTAISKTLEAKTKLLTVTLGVNDSLVRHVEMPPMPVEDMRLMLKTSSRSYLQQDLSGHVFDCNMAGLPQTKTKSKEQPKSGTAPQKQKVLIAGAKKQMIDEYHAAIKSAGFIPDHILPGVIGPVNAFEKALPEIFAKEVVALVDIGFKSSSISILQEGELILSRIVNIGGDRLTQGLAENLNINYNEAEGIKVGMPQEVLNVLETLIAPLGRELRASLDFFEHQQDRTVSQVFVSGGSARSEFVIQSLRQELMVECCAWNPAAFLELALPEKQAAEIELAAPQLTVAIGAALTAF
jgi:type IV pilus assembly protein PilM